MRSKPLPYHREKLEEELLRKAAEIVSTRGPEALSLRELGRSAKVSRSAPYHYFPDKAALLARVGELGFQKLKAHIESRAGALSNPAARVRMGFRAYVEFASEEEHFFRLMFANVLRRHLKSGAGSPTAAFAFSSVAAQEAFGQMLNGVTEFQRSRKSDNRDTLLLTNVLWSFAHGVAVLRLDVNLKYLDLDAVLQTGLDALLAD